MRGNRAQKVNASNYQAFDSPTYHKLALLGVEVDWQTRYLLQVRLTKPPVFCSINPSHLDSLTLHMLTSYSAVVKPVEFADNRYSGQLSHGGQVEGVYRPRFGLDPSVIRLPIVPGSDPRAAYGDLVERGVKGVVLEAFGELILSTL